VADAADGHGIHGKTRKEIMLPSPDFSPGFRMLAHENQPGPGQASLSTRCFLITHQWNHPESGRLPGVFPCYSVAIEKVTTPAKSPGISNFIAGIIPAGSHCLSACGISGVRFL
jgi:hypothetical protein